jgi:hypothetical protein
MFVFATVLKGLIEVLLVVMLGQGLLYLFAGTRRQENLVYRAFATVTAPIMKAARFVTPRFVVDQHIGFVAFFLLALAWVLALALKVHAVLEAAKGPV